MRSQGFLSRIGNIFRPRVRIDQGLCSVVSIGQDRTLLPISTAQEVNSLLRLCPPANTIISKISSDISQCVLRATSIDSEASEQLPRCLSSSNIYETLSLCATYLLRYGYCAIYSPYTGSKRDGNNCLLRPLDPTNLVLGINESLSILDVNSEDIIASAEYFSESISPSDLFLVIDGSSTGITSLLSGLEVFGRTVNASILIRKYIAIQELEGANIDGRGQAGVFYLKASERGNYTTPAQMEEAERKFEKEIGFGLGKKRTVFTNREVGYIDASKSIQDIVPYNRINNVVDELALCYGYPADMISTSGNKTFSNYETATRNAFQSCIIPLANSIVRQICEGIGVSALGINVECDFSSVPELKEDKRSAAEVKMLYLSYFKEMRDAGVISEGEFKDRMVQIEKEL